MPGIQYVELLEWHSNATNEITSDDQIDHAAVPPAQRLCKTMHSLPL